MDRRVGQHMEVVDDQRDRRVLGSQRRREPQQERVIRRPASCGG